MILLLIYIFLQFMWRKDYLLHRTYLQKILWILTCFRLALLSSVSYFFFLYWSPISFLFYVFDSISPNIGEIFSINPSNLFVFVDFNVHHED